VGPWGIRETHLALGRSIEPFLSSLYGGLSAFPALGIHRSQAEAKLNFHAFRSRKHMRHSTVFIVPEPAMGGAGGVIEATAALLFKETL
jgi:hypothetical protein